MKYFKTLLGICCLGAALFFLCPVMVYGFVTEAAVLLFITGGWLFITGFFLLARRDKPFSKWGRRLLVLNGVLGVCFMALALLPAFVGSRTTSCCNACINNLRQIDAAACQFALENHLTNGQKIHFPQDLTPYIKLNNQGQIPGCPNGGIYHLRSVGETPTCSLGNTVTPGHFLP